MLNSYSKFLRHFRWTYIAIFSLALVVAVSSCSKKEVKEDEPLINPSGDTGGAAVDATPPVDTGAVTTENATEALPTGDEMKVVYFDFDSYRINNAGRDSLKSDADWLKKNPNATIQIEGHCDERGTTEYNLALGERRANAARDYLVKLGVDKSRLSVISYGKERPADPGHDEAAWSRNRRASFVVLSR